MTSNEQLRAEVERIVNGARGRSLSPIKLGAPVDAHTVDRQLEHARELAAVDTIGEQRRFATAKHVVMRTAQLFLKRQSAFNEQTVELLALLNHQLAAHAASVEQRTAALSAALVDLELRFEDAVEDVQRGARGLTEGIEEELGSLRRSVGELVSDHDAFRRTDPALHNGTATRRLDRRYAEFEDQFRGTRGDIEGLLEPYLDDIFPSLASGGAVLDIGSGRGEWLQLLAARGIPATGIDTSEEAAAGCVAIGLDVLVGDGVEHLESLPEASLAAVTAFHVLEHLPVAVHARLLDAAFRALVPGGALIVETPNPTNLVVGAAAFYRDPSHVRPIHPDYLRFLAADCGFVGNEIRFLHPRAEYESLELPDDDLIAGEVAWAIFGPQDFAVIGRRADGSTATP